MSLCCPSYPTKRGRCLECFTEPPAGGPPAPEGFKDAYVELQRHGFALGNAITDKGKEAIHERFMGSDPNFRSRS
jgi:hypothetical protein